MLTCWAAELAPQSDSLLSTETAASLHGHSHSTAKSQSLSTPIQSRSQGHRTGRVVPACNAPDLVREQTCLQESCAFPWQAQEPQLHHPNGNCSWGARISTTFYGLRTLAMLPHLISAIIDFDSCTIFPMLGFSWFAITKRADNRRDIWLSLDLGYPYVCSACLEGVLNKCILTEWGLQPRSINIP